MLICSFLVYVCGFFPLILVSGFKILLSPKYTFWVTFINTAWPRVFFLTIWYVRAECNSPWPGVDSQQRISRFPFVPNVSRFVSLLFHTSCWTGDCFPFHLSVCRCRSCVLPFSWTLTWNISNGSTMASALPSPTTHIRDKMRTLGHFSFGRSPADTCFSSIIFIFNPIMYH